MITECKRERSLWGLQCLTGSLPPRFSQKVGSPLDWGRSLQTYLFILWKSDSVIGGSEFHSPFLLLNTICLSRSTFGHCFQHGWTIVTCECPRIFKCQASLYFCALRFKSIEVNILLSHPDAWDIATRGLG